MPVALPAIAGTLTSSLMAVGLLGTDVSKLATGVGTGLQSWIPTIQVITVDAGTAGAGSNVPSPLLVPQPALLGALQSMIAAAGFAGQSTPQLATGLANGLAQAFLAMLVVTQHPGVGTGTGVATFICPPAAGPMAAGFASASLLGEASPRLAAAIGNALDTVFASLVMSVVIVGPASPTASSGSGTGKIL
jgi:hypothetical protein